MLCYYALTRWLATSGAFCLRPTCFASLACRIVTIQAFTFEFTSPAALTSILLLCCAHIRCRRVCQRWDVIVSLLRSANSHSTHCFVAYLQRLSLLTPPFFWAAWESKRRVLKLGVAIPSQQRRTLHSQCNTYRVWCIWFELYRS